MGTRQVELTTTIHSTIAVIVRFTLEEPLIRHFVDLPFRYSVTLWS
jgi:hypothetical protein